MDNVDPLLAYADRIISAYSEVGRASRAPDLQFILDRARLRLIEVHRRFTEAGHQSTLIEKPAISRAGELAVEGMFVQVGGSRWAAIRFSRLDTRVEIEVSGPEFRSVEARVCALGAGVFRVSRRGVEESVVSGIDQVIDQQLEGFLSQLDPLGPRRS